MTKKINEIKLIVRELMQSLIKSRADLESFKRKVAKKYKVSCPKNVELLKAYHGLLAKKSIQRNKKIEEILRMRPVRSLSGIVNVSVLTKPYPCPGKCIFCPSEKNIPKSYVSGEPAVERAKTLKYNPYLQVQKRIEALAKTGHPIDKIELRVIGGTWSYYPRRYQTWFIRRCFQACNEYKGCAGQTSTVLRFDLNTLQKRNEKAKCKIVGITIETRPDFVNIEEIKRMRKLGITRVELGVQSIYDDVLKLSRRGHNVEATIRATKLLKDAGFKVSYQMMPDLPGSNFNKDVKMFEELFSNPNFQPDLLKIYPLALVKEAPLYKWYKQGKFRPYSQKQLLKLLIEIKKQLPYYCRVQRIIRDIPSEDIVEGGAKISNLREVVQKEMTRQGAKCKCIRCREIKASDPKEKPQLFRQDYDASDGKEIFLSFENKKRTKLYALLRLRLRSPKRATADAVRPQMDNLPVLKDAALIREVHTYGQLVPIEQCAGTKQAVQHKGLGKKLIKEAEKIAHVELSQSAKKEFGVKKIAAIAAVGTREYWRKLGYKLKDTYMVKELKNLSR